MPAEAVFGALEVKQTMDRSMIEYAAGNMGSVRRLRRTSVPYVEGEYKPKKLQTIIGGLLTMESDWKPPMGEPLERALADFGGDGRLDMGCALRHGAFEVSADDGSIERSDDDSALIFFVVRCDGRIKGGEAPQGESPHRTAG